jgi:hypothetical protein
MGRASCVYIEHGAPIMFLLIVRTLVLRSHGCFSLYSFPPASDQLLERARFRYPGTSSSLTQSSTMNNTADLAESAPAGPGYSPSTIEVIIGLFALVLALATVVIAIIQLHQARAARHQHRQPEPELGQANIELPTITSHVAVTDPVGNNTR